MTSIPQFAPGCFGSALAFQEDHFVCRSCKFMEQCRPLHVENRRRLREELNIPEKTQKRFEMKPRTEENPNPGAKILPKKVREYIERIDSMGLNITGNLKEGINPFKPGKMSFLYIAAHLLMHMNRPLRANMLAHAYMSKLKCRDNTAEAYARIAMQIFQHVGAVDEMDGGFTLRRS